MLRAAVLGSPIAHSLSPLLHRAAYAALGLDDWDYSAHELVQSDLPGFLVARDTQWRGLSLTMPLKEVALVVADSVSELAARVGAANTLVRLDEQSWRAENTDVHGIRQALAGVSHCARATILGNGATSRSALAALGELGIEDVQVAARRPVGSDVLLSPGVVREGDLVVSTLPPTAAEIVASVLRPEMAAYFDVVYADWPTPPAIVATEFGVPVISGLVMLVHQAVAQVELFTGQSVSPEMLFTAIESSL